MINTKIRELEHHLTEVINSYIDVPIDAKRLIVTNLMYAVSAEADRAIIAEMESNNAEST